MPFLNLPGMGVVHLKMARPRKRKCAHCGAPDAQYLCDWPMTDGDKTCDKPCCARCSVRVGTDRDYCKGHPRAGAIAVQTSLEFPRGWCK